MPAILLSIIKGIVKPCILLLALVVGAVVLTGCPLETTKEKSDLARAQEAFANQDIGDAEMYYERYLRKNPNGEARWEVWQKLLTISLDIKRDRTTGKDYLEIMLVEFENDAPRRRKIQMELARLCKEMRLYDRALALWEALAEDTGLTDPDKAEIYRSLAQSYMQRLEFIPALEILDHCLSLDVTADTKAGCLSTMAEVNALNNDLKKSEQALRDILVLKGLSQERHVLITFALADILEQQNRLKESEELFESIRESYPNTRVVEIRLATIKKKQMPKVPDVVKRPW